MSKSLCDLVKLVKKDLAAYVKLVDQPRYVCKKCGRVANEKKLVCSPLKIVKREK